MIDLISLSNLGLSVVQKDGIVSMDGRRIKTDQYADGRFRALLTAAARTYAFEFFLHITNIAPCFFPEDISAEFHFSRRRKNPAISTSCRGCRYGHVCPGWEQLFPGKKPALRPLPVKMVPKEVVFELTRRCNQKCVFCKKGFSSKDISCQHIIDQMDAALALGVSAVRFTGGEPLLYRRLPVLLKEAKRRKFYVLLNTNGLVFSERHETAFLKYVDNVLISLQGCSPATEASLTGGTTDFSRKIKNIRRIKSCVPVLRIGTIASDIFLAHLGRYKILIDFLNVAAWEVYRPMIGGPRGRGGACRTTDFNRIAAYLIHIKKTRGIHGVIGNAFPFCCLKPALIRRDILLGGTADDGHSRIVYDAGGYFKPSYFIDVNLGKDLRKSWESPLMKKIRSLDYLVPACRACRWLRWCRGGSRFLAHETYGNYFQTDPLLGKYAHGDGSIDSDNSPLLARVHPP
jgi:radical SAM protein with 4Fe4S-binding SPASM domain